MWSTPKKCDIEKLIVTWGQELYILCLVTDFFLCSGYSTRGGGGGYSAYPYGYGYGNQQHQQQNYGYGECGFLMKAHLYF